MQKRGWFSLGREVGQASKDSHWVPVVQTQDVSRQNRGKEGLTGWLELELISPLVKLPLPFRHWGRENAL